MRLNNSDIQNIYEELLELEGLALLIKERLENEPLQLSRYFADKLSRLNVHVSRLIDAEVSVGSDECAIADSAEIEESEDADIDNDITVETDLDASISAPEIVYGLGQTTDCDNMFAGGNPDESRASKLDPGDLRKSFTINDRFRFRRELFGNNDTDMTDTINMVSAMNSFVEAEEYFYDDLGWDKSADEVKDFMAIIERHFNGRVI